jgi:hypothetical protein
VQGKRYLHHAYKEFLILLRKYSLCNQVVRQLCQLVCRTESCKDRKVVPDPAYCDKNIYHIERLLINLTHFNGFTRDFECPLSLDSRR